MIDENLAHHKQINFGGFRLDETNECLWRGSQVISLRPKMFAVLKYLLEHAGHYPLNLQFS
jgi:DNA-binding response OmpR family regulator